jgi:uncharacterized protein YbjQ (UPF0145 family)
MIAEDLITQYTKENIPYSPVCEYHGCVLNESMECDECMGDIIAHSRLFHGKGGDIKRGTAIFRRVMKSIPEKEMTPIQKEAMELLEAIL